MYVPKAPSKTTTRSWTASRNGWSRIGQRYGPTSRAPGRLDGRVGTGRRGRDGADQGPGGSVACRMPRERIYTRTGDDGTTGLLYGGRVRKDGELPDGLRHGRRGAGRRSAWPGPSPSRVASSAELLVGLERDLWVLMAELATAPGEPRQAHAGDDAGDRRDGRRARGASSTTLDDAVRAADGVRRPGRDRRRGLLDLARTVVRRAERARPGRRRRRRRSSCRTSTGSPTCCGPWPAGRRASPARPGRSPIPIRSTPPTPSEPAADPAEESVAASDKEHP